MFWENEGKIHKGVCEEEFFNKLELEIYYNFTRNYFFIDNFHGFWLNEHIILVTPATYTWNSSFPEVFYKKCVIDALSKSCP